MFRNGMWIMRNIHVDKLILSLQCIHVAGGTLSEEPFQS